MDNGQKRKAVQKRAYDYEDMPRLSQALAVREGALFLIRNKIQDTNFIVQSCAH